MFQCFRVFETALKHLIIGTAGFRLCVSSVSGVSGVSGCFTSRLIFFCPQNPRKTQNSRSKDTEAPIFCDVSAVSLFQVFQVFQGVSLGS